MLNAVPQTRQADAAIVRPGFDIVSLSTSIFVFAGIVAALQERRQSGRGQRVEVSMLAAIAAMLQWNLASEFNPDEWVGKQITAYEAPPEHPFVLRDGAANIDLSGDIIGGNTKGWHSFMTAVGRPDLTRDARFNTRDALSRNMSQLRDELADTLANWSARDLDHLISQLGSGGSMVFALSPLESAQIAVDGGLYPDTDASLTETVARPWQFSAFGFRPSREYEDPFDD